MPSKKLVVAIPVHNALNHFREMIDSLFAHTYNFNLFLCNDFSDAETSRYIDSLPYKVLIKHRKQLWWTRSANDLIISSYVWGADYIFLLNSDIVIHSDSWTDSLISPIEEDEKVGLVGSVYNPKASKTNYIPTHPPQYVTGHAWCIPRRTIEIAGILDERYVHITSDAEYCHRLNKLDLKTLINASTKITHKFGKSWGLRVDKIPNGSYFTPSPRNIYCLKDQSYVESIRERLK